jgi:hypothetical protein
MEINVIEQEQVERDYGMQGVEAIVEHPEHGLIYIADGFGGMDTMRGGAVRWEHGMAVKLQPGDTLENLRETEWNDSTTLFRAMLEGYDESRPVLQLTGRQVSAIAKAAGL